MQKKIMAAMLGLALADVSAAPKLIGYFPGWTPAKRADFQVDKIDLSKWDRVTYAFYQVALDGGVHAMEMSDAEILLGKKVQGSPRKTDRQLLFSAMPKPGSDTADKYLNESPPVITRDWYQSGTGLISLAHKAGAEFYISIGGWTLSSNFPTVAANPQFRARMAGDCARLVREYGLDGIDVDWEFPGYADHHGTPEDKANYILLMQQIKDSLDVQARKDKRKYGLTAALPCSPYFKNMGIDVAALKPILTGFNLMTYDLHGTWDKVAGHNSPMYSPDGLSVDACRALYAAEGVSPEKIQIGAGFYGRHFAGAQDMGQRHQGPIEGFVGEDFGYYSYVARNVASGAWVEKWDSAAVAPYAVLDKGVFSYENAKSLAYKGKYVRDQGLGGIIVWDMAGDLDQGKTPLLDALQPMRKAK